MPDKTQKTANPDLKTIKVRKHIHRAIKVESTERDENIEDTVERAWHAYAGGPQAEAGESAKPPRKYQSYVGRLAGILASGDSVAIEAAVKVIELCEAHVRKTQ